MEYIRVKSPTDPITIDPNFQRDIQVLAVHGNVWKPSQANITLRETNSSPLKISRDPRGKDRIPTIHFQVRTVSFREGILEESWLFYPAPQTIFFATQDVYIGPHIGSMELVYLATFS